MLIGVSPSYCSFSIIIGFSLFIISYPKRAQKIATSIKMDNEIKVPKKDLKEFCYLYSSWIGTPNKSILLTILKAFFNIN